MDNTSLQHQTYSNLAERIRKGQKIVTTRVTSMGSLFQNKTTFNEDISHWDVSNVTMMYHMFNGASSFNQNLSAWDVSSVTDMYLMFYNASVFNQNLSAWDVSSVTDMDNMFDGGAWDRTSYTNPIGNKTLPTGTLRIVTQLNASEVEWANYWTLT